MNIEQRWMELTGTMDNIMPSMDLDYLLVEMTYRRTS